MTLEHRAEIHNGSVAGENGGSVLIAAGEDSSGRDQRGVIAEWTDERVLLGQVPDGNWSAFDFALDESSERFESE